jgi:hypothetical protein
MSCGVRAPEPSTIAGLDPVVAGLIGLTVVTVALVVWAEARRARSGRTCGQGGWSWAWAAMAGVVANVWAHVRLLAAAARRSAMPVAPKFRDGAGPSAVAATRC